jgi:pimeloyl-ACP methyl ester carboxylesterase
MYNQRVFGAGFVIATMITPWSAWAQENTAPPPMQDPTLNNLVHPEGYETCALGELGAVEQIGNGAQTLVLIPGWGFDSSIFKPIIDGDSDEYSYLLLTPAGYSQTQAPPMPGDDVSYGDRTWWRAFESSVWNEIKYRDIQDPVFVVFLDSAQSAVMLASEHGDQIRGIVSIAGLPQMEFQQPFPKDMRSQIVDSNVSQMWFKTVTQETWNNGMGSSAWYSADDAVGAPLYAASLVSPVPTMVRYYCEHWATDIMDEAAAIACPVLALQPDPEEGTDVDMYPEFVARALIGPWTAIADSNGVVETRIIAGARMGLMQTHSGEIRTAIDEFVATLDASAEDVRKVAVAREAAEQCDFRQRHARVHDFVQRSSQSKALRILAQPDSHLLGEDTTQMPGRATQSLGDCIQSPGPRLFAEHDVSCPPAEFTPHAIAPESNFLHRPRH